MVLRKIGQAWWPYFIIAILVMLPYLPTFTGGFILDDNPLIKENSYLREPHSFFSYMIQEDGITDKINNTNEHTGYYRPLITLTYRLDYILWGMNATGFRATNFIFHLLTCLILYKMLFSIIKNRHAAFWATILFSLHPINTESVSWIAARNNILATLFSLSTWYFFIRHLDKNGYLSYILSILSFVGAIFSKEFGIMTLPILFLSQSLLQRTGPNLSKDLLKFAPFVIVLFFYFILRQNATNLWFSPPEVDIFWKRIYFAPYLIALNFFYIVFPTGLHNFISDYPATYLDWKAFAGFFYICVLGMILWICRKDKVVLSSILFFHLGLFPVLNIIPTSAVTLFSMRWLYFPMAFLTLAGAHLISKSFNVNRFISMGILSIITIYAGGYSYVLNKYLWRDEGSFLRQEVLHFNNHFFAGPFAENLLSKGDYIASEKYFRMAITEYPGKIKNYINFSALLIETARYNEAISVLKRSETLLKTSKDRGEWNNNMGTAYFGLKEHTTALNYFKKAVKYRPGDGHFWGNLGAAYGAIGDYENAVSASKRGLSLSPASKSLSRIYSLAYRRMMNHEKNKGDHEEISQNDWNANYCIKGLRQD